MIILLPIALSVANTGSLRAILTSLIQVAYVQRIEYNFSNAVNYQLINITEGERTWSTAARHTSDVLVARLFHNIIYSDTCHHIMQQQ